MGILVAPIAVYAVVQTLNGQTGSTQSFTTDGNITIDSSNNVHAFSLNDPITVGNLSVGSIYNRLSSNGYLGILAQNGGPLELNSGDGVSQNPNGGDLLIVAGSGYGPSNGNGGDVVIYSGTPNQAGAGGGTYGKIRLRNSGSINEGAIMDVSLMTTNQTFTFPDVTGTVSVLSANQTFTGLNKFEAVASSSLYIGSSTKSGCLVLGDSDGSGVTYITANNGVLTASSSKPAVCQ